MGDEQLLERITASPFVMVGKPVIKGTRLTVDYITRRLAQGSSESEILEEYHGIAVEDIRACVLFAALKPDQVRPRSAPQDDDLFGP